MFFNQTGRVGSVQSVESVLNHRAMCYAKSWVETCDVFNVKARKKKKKRKETEKWRQGSVRQIIDDNEAQQQVVCWGQDEGFKTLAMEAFEFHVVTTGGATFVVSLLLCRQLVPRMWSNQVNSRYKHFGFSYIATLTIYEALPTYALWYFYVAVWICKVEWL